MRLTQLCRWRCVSLTILLLGLFPWTPASAQAEKHPSGGHCLAFQKDLMDPYLLEALRQRHSIPAGAVQSTYPSRSRKISTQTFFLDGGLEKLMQVTVSCTGTCTGGCGVSGCDVTSSLDCSGCECSGGLCTSCSCTKKSTVVTPSSR